MKTKQFESAIKSALEPVASDWVERLKNQFPNISVKTIKTHTSYEPDGKIFKKLVKCDLNLKDEMILLTIAQDRDTLEFFYFGIKPDETSDECLHKLYFEYADNQNA
jgi:hypothetical protein